jgi:translation initiation factor 2D
MFKKPFKIASEDTLAAKDRKKMRQDLSDQFDKDSVEKLFIYAETIKAQKLEKSKIVIYRDETDPLVIDSTSNKDYFPTVYALMMFPDLIKFVFVLKPDEEKSLKNGGQLMWPSVANFENLPDFQGDEVVAIKSSTGKIIAVGAIACSKKSLEGAEKNEGAAAYILHMLNDQLYDSGSKQEKAVVFRKPTAEELKQKDEEEKKGKDANKNEEEDEDLLTFYKQLNKNKNTGGVKTANLKKNVIKAPAKSKANAREDRSDDEDKKKGKKKKDAPKPAGKNQKETKNQKDGEEDEEDNKEGDGNQVSTKEMDKHLMEAFLNCLIISLDEDDLPIENANLWNNHLLPCRTPGTVLDIKNTSFKKLAKFFSHMDKLGIITFKEATKKSATASITHINRKNLTLSDWEPTISAPMSKEEEEKEGKEGKGERLVITHEIVNMCKPDSLLKKYLNLAPDAEVVTHDEMEKKIKDFLKKSNLLQKDQVIVNDMLKEDFNIEVEDSEDEEADLKSAECEDEVKETKKHDNEDKKKKKGAKAPAVTIKLTKFMQMIEKHLTYLYKIIDLKSKKETIKQGKFEGVNIFAEKAHNKFLTRVTSLGVFGLNLEALLAEWQAKFSATGSIHEVVINKQHVKEISLQGLFLDEIKDYLTSIIRIPENLIVTVNKVDKKKKKGTKQM